MIMTYHDNMSFALTCLLVTKTGQNTAAWLEPETVSSNIPFTRQLVLQVCAHTHTIDYTTFFALAPLRFVLWDSKSQLALKPRRPKDAHVRSAFPVALVFLPIITATSQQMISMGYSQCRWWWRGSHYFTGFDMIWVAPLGFVAAKSGRTSGRLLHCRNGRLLFTLTLLIPCNRSNKTKTS